MILGDNILENPIKAHVDQFKAQGKGAKILLKEVHDPHRFGVAEVADNGNVLSIEEKPRAPKSNLAVIGVYMYDAHVYEIISTLKPSARGELEITDVNNAYLREGTLTSSTIDGWWTDAGTFPSLYRASRLVAEQVKPELKEFWD